MSSGRASSSDGAQVYWGNDGVWEEEGGEGCTWMVAQVAWMKSVLHGCQKTHEELSLRPEQRPETNDACEDTHARNIVLMFVCRSK